MSWCLRRVVLCDEQWSRLKPASLTSNIVTSTTKPYQAQWDFFRVNEMDKTQAIHNLCNKSIFKTFQSDSGIVDRVGDIEHYDWSYKNWTELIEKPKTNHYLYSLLPSAFPKLAKGAAMFVLASFVTLSCLLLLPWLLLTFIICTNTFQKADIGWHWYLVSVLAHS